MPKRSNSDPELNDNAKSAKYDEPQNIISEQAVKIPYKDKIIDGMLTLPTPTDNNNHTAIILTHGAGGDMNIKQLKYLSEYLSRNGFTILRFTCRGLNINYKTNVYKSTLRFIHSNAEEYGIKKCVLGGRSMGCRAALQLANQLQERKEPELSDFVVGIICLAYPLHLQDEKDKLRDEPLLTLKLPVLFITGTEDEMAEKKVFEEVIKKMPGSPMIHWLEGIGHSHTSRKAEQLNVEKNVCEAVKSWMLKLGRD